jgi:hypothetical protein
MFLALALPAAAIVGGTLATYFYDRRIPILWRLPSGICLGLSAIGLIGFVLASWLGLHTPALLIAGVLVLSPVALLIVGSYRRAVGADLAALRRSLSQLKQLRRGTLLRALAYALGMLLLWQVADRTMFVRSGGIYTGVSHNIGDLPFHLSVMNRFVYGQNFPPEHPSFAGTRFTYPFLTDFLGSMLMRAGMPVRTVIVWSTFLLCVVLAALMYRWTLSLTGSRTAAFVAPALTLMNGGLGWGIFIREVMEPGGWAMVAHLSHDYTMTRDNTFRWGNLVTTLLVTQRGLLLGLPLALVVFQGWWQAISPSDDQRRDRRLQMIAAGCAAGLLPLIHAHTYAVVLAMAACLAVITRDPRLWMSFFVPSLALGLPQVWWVGQGGAVQSASFIAWSVGWDHGKQNVALFWLKNTGPIIPLIVIALCWRGQRPLVPRTLLMFYLPFTLCFVVPNLLRLAPWIWDNIKVLTYWFVASVPIVALLLARLSQSGRPGQLLAAILFVTMTFSGALDLWRVAANGFQARVFNRQDVEFGAIVAQKTAPNSLILHAPTYNHPVVLTGRRSLMGYPGHIWSHGLQGGPREADIKRMYAGGAEAEALLERYAIDYVVIGPLEHRQVSPNEAFFERYALIGELGEYRLYRIPDVDEQRQGTRGRR